MKNDTQTGYVAATAADRGPEFPAFPRNPLACLERSRTVAFAMALIGSLVGLFRRRGTPTAVEKTKLEHYRSTPVSLPPAGRSKDGRTTGEGPSNDVPERRTVAVRGYLRRAPAGCTAARKGGRSHG